MKIAVLGASGRTGQLVINQGIARGHVMTALARDAGRFPSRDGVTVIAGDPMNPADVERALVGADGVIMTLNNARASDAPWAKPLSPPSLLETAARNCAAAMERNGPSRLVMLSAIGVGDSFSDTQWIMRMFIQYTNLKVAYADHNRTETFIRSTGLDWTLVRAVGLSNSAKYGRLIIGTARDPKPAMMIPRAMVARFLLHCIETGEHSRSTPVVSAR